MSETKFTAAFIAEQRVILEATDTAPGQWKAAWIKDGCYLKVDGRIAAEFFDWGGGGQAGHNSAYIVQAARNYPAALDEIERLRNIVNRRPPEPEWSELRAENEQLKRERDAAMVALKPFAAFAKAMDIVHKKQPYADDDAFYTMQTLEGPVEITAGDLRRALEVFATAKGTREGEAK